MSFKNAVNNVNTNREDNLAFTANGDVSLNSTLNPLVDLFFMIGSLRGKPFNAYSDTFKKAFNHNKRLTMQMLLWVRDIRGGAGERDTFRNMMQWLEKNHPDEMAAMVPVIAEYGRFDDLLIFTTPAIKKIAYDTIKNALLQKNALAAKWMPREQKMKRSKDGSINMSSVANINRVKNNTIAKELADHMNLTPRQYRKLLSSLTDVVETKLCNKDYENIDYNKLPSVASSKYITAFMRNDEARYRAYLNGLTKGTSTVNAGALYPYDVYLNVRKNPQLADAQWEQLPNFMGDNRILPMIDTSGSMGVSVGGSNTLTCMDVAVSLGLYVANKQTGAFHNMYLTFNSDSHLCELKGETITELAKDLRKYEHDWGGSTNLDSAYTKVLEVAKSQQVAPEDMPKFIMIMSDMEFNSACRGDSAKTANERIANAYRSAGYEVPKIVFWNLNAREGNNPVRFDTKGTALISGLSPNVLSAVLSGKDIDPVQVMLAAIDSPRYRIFG